MNVLRKKPSDLEQIKIGFQYILMLTAALVLGWLLPRFFSDSFLEAAQSGVYRHFALPFSSFADIGNVLRALLRFFAPTGIALVIVFLFSFSSLSCLVTDGVLIYLGMRTGCTLSVLWRLRGASVESFHLGNIHLFVFSFFKFLILFIFLLYAFYMARYAYQLRKYSQSGRTLFPPKTVAALIVCMFAAGGMLFVLHAIYGYLIYLLS